MKELIRRHYPTLLAFLAGWIAEVLTDLGGYVRALIERLAQ